jgi:hypothetical protein
MHRSTIFSALFTFLLLAPGAIALGQTPEEEAREAFFTPTVAETSRAFAMAEQAIQAKGLRTTGPFYNISAELYREKNAPTRNRLILVTSYRYSGDVAILSYVDLTKGVVTRVDTVAHTNVHLSEAEYLLAKEKALSHPKVRQQLGEYLSQIKVEAMVSHSAYEKDPLFGHRVVRLLFKVPGSGYLAQPIIFVDLTANQVLIDPEPNHSHAAVPSAQKH